MTNQIPVFCLSGFLGSGKTTLLVKLLKEAGQRGLKPGILMNELGKQDVDGFILNEETGFQIEKLLDGCVCCSKKEELAQSLQTILHTNPDVLFIELTGVANPVEIADLLSTPPFKHLVRLEHSITLLDAEHALEYNSRFSADKELVNTLHQQLISAKIVLVNKADLVNESKLSKVVNMVRKLNPSASVKITQHSDLNVQELLSSFTPGADMTLKRNPFHVLRSQQNHSHDFTTNNDSISAGAEAASSSFSKVKTITLSCPAKETVSQPELENFLNQLEGQIIRAKGYIMLEETGTSLVQYAGGHLSSQPSRYPGEGYIVIIGLALDPVNAAKHWEQLFTTKRNQLIP